MESWKKKRSLEYTIDVSKIDGPGPFPCPKCKSVISPDEEESHTIIDTKVKNDELEKLVIKCNKCESKITLTGFISQS